MIVALGALVGMLGGVVTAAPALARGPKWQFVQVPPSLTLKALYCGFKIRQTFPVDRAYAKILKSSDGSMTSLINGSVKTTFTNLSTGKTINANISGPAKKTESADGSLVFESEGLTAIALEPPDAKRFGLPTCS